MNRVDQTVVCALLASVALSVLVGGLVLKGKVLNLSLLLSLNKLLIMQLLGLIFVFHFNQQAK